METKLKDIFPIEDIQSFIADLLRYEENAVVVATIPIIAFHIQGVAPRIHGVSLQILHIILKTQFQGALQAEGVILQVWGVILEVQSVLKIDGMSFSSKGHRI